MPRKPDHFQPQVPNARREEFYQWMSGEAKEESTSRKEHNDNNFLSAVVDGKLLDMPAFCQHHGLKFTDVVKYKLVTHNGGAYYNITMEDQDFTDDHATNLKKIKDQLKKGITPNTAQTSSLQGRVGVVSLADLHIGAVTEGFNLEVIKERLLKIAQETNDKGMDSVVVNILGDVIESFSGQNHRNTWKHLEHGMHGANVVKVATEILDTFLLSEIDNLAKINFVGGNHGRLTQSKEEDSESGAEDLIAWGLSLKGYDVKFDPRVISQEIDGVNYILTHGDKRLSTLSGSEMVLNYGNPNMMNMILSGHLHNAKQQEDSGCFIKHIISSIIDKNEYSKDGGWTAKAGYFFCRNKGEGIPSYSNEKLN